MSRPGPAGASGGLDLTLTMSVEATLRGARSRRPAGEVASGWLPDDYLST
jgi:hypothetical protein